MIYPVDSFIYLFNNPGWNVIFIFLFCPGATTDDPGLNGTALGVENTNSFLCPQGYYSQSGDHRLYPCPNGTFNDQLGASHKGQCKPCAVDHYNPYVARNSCLSCRPLQSKEGSDTCTCRGQNRVYKVCEKETNEMFTSSQGPSACNDYGDASGDA